MESRDRLRSEVFKVYKAFYLSEKYNFNIHIKHTTYEEGTVNVSRARLFFFFCFVLNASGLDKKKDLNIFYGSHCENIFENVLFVGFSHSVLVWVSVGLLT